MQGYLTRSGMVFKTSLKIVSKDGRWFCNPKVIAEPGELVNVEDGLLYNLSRAIMGYPSFVYPVGEARFVQPVVN